jgi:GNAT superfamily N-acetyltransferase
LGLRKALLDWALTSATNSVHKAPDGARVIVVTFVSGMDRSGAALFESAGMSLVRYYNEMQVVFDGSPAPPEWPEGIRVRTMNRASDEEAFVRAIDEGFVDHWGHVEQPFEQIMEHWTHVFDSYPGFDESLAFMAMDGDEIAGVSLCMKEADFDADLGWVDKFAVLRPWRKRGLGLALLQHSFAEFYQRGKRKVGLGVDASSLTGATRLYEKAGMHPVNQFVLYEMELRPGVDLSLQELEVKAEEGKTS